MFGHNPIRGRENDPQNLAVTTIFYTLQGEGPFSGQPALFIRLAGCNLACTFCDTEFERGADAPMPLQTLGQMVSRFPLQHRKLVVITGGEPLRQNLSALVELLYELGTEHIQIETAGTLWVEGLVQHINEHRLTIVCSPKTPGIHPMIRRYCKHWKYVVRASDPRDPADGLPIGGTQRATEGKPSALARPPKQIDPGRTVWLSPCDEYDAGKNKANLAAAAALCLHWGYRLSIQVHKLVGLE